jgi:ankyrin repeat protein
MVQLLLQNGAQCHTFDTKRWLPIHYAAKGNHLLIAECILKKAGCIWSAFDRSKSVLLAAENADEGMLRLLIDHNANVDSRGVFKETALMKTVRRGHWPATKLLLDKGAEVELKNCFGRTALFYAAAEGHTQIVQLLISKGALPISKEAQTMSRNDDSPFSIAVENGHTEIIHLLLQHDARLRRHPACPAEMMERDKLGGKHKRRRLR